MNEKFELPDGSYSILDIQDYFKYIIKKHETVTDNLLIRTYVCKIDNRIKFKIKTGYYLELLTPETMKLVGSAKSKTTKNENSQNVPHLEITEVVLVHCNIVNNNHEQKSIVLCTFVCNKPFVHLLENSVKHLIFLKTFDSEFSYIEVCFIDQIK